MLGMFGQVTSSTSTKLGIRQVLRLVTAKEPPYRTDFTDSTAALQMLGFPTRNIDCPQLVQEIIILHKYLLAKSNSITF